jgi:hypothetical protein
VTPGTAQIAQTNLRPTDQAATGSAKPMLEKVEEKEGT